jgi:peptidoglycan hydrolase CwlO-like protein
VTEEVRKGFDGWVSPDDAKKAADQIAELTGQISEKEKAIAELTAKTRAYEISSAKLKIAQEVGLPAELADRITGETEEEMRKDAEQLVRFTKPQHQQHRFSSERTEGLSGVEQAFFARNPDLRKE